ncbi:ABC transporter ATP-binding protein [Corynebacterium uterequi]|uniref:ABC transporter ATP-binding protein n=1 Tax=Corynebacterium uterequi TaxID=1072256 RepID=UPI0009E4D39A|nr:ABC transporter ATP-binding protein [Corynebacterium uterequi]
MIEVRGLGKKFPGNDFYSLRDATFDLNEGDIIGLVGRNGSGKSTLLKMLSKAQRPTEGTIHYNGKDIFSAPNILDDFGFMIEPAFFPQISVEENLEFFLKIQKKNHDRPKIAPTLELVGLWEARKRKPRTFSFGMKQRTALAIALVSKPSIVFLDEPFVGLDPVGVQSLLDILKKWSSENGTSMIISSHQLNELRELCNRYLFIESGNLTDNVNDNLIKTTVTLNAEAEGNIDETLSKILLESNVAFEGHRIAIPSTLDNALMNRLYMELGSRNLIKSVDSRKDSLENLFKGEDK